MSRPQAEDNDAMTQTTNNGSYEENFDPTDFDSGVVRFIYFVSRMERKSPIQGATQAANDL